MGIETIKTENEKATRKAKRESRKPYIALSDCDSGVTACPLLGDYIPKGYYISNTYFVDNSGLGAEDEIALTYSQFLDKVRKGHGYAISSVGQFQVYINEFRMKI